MVRARKPKVAGLVRAARDYRDNLLNRNVLLVGVSGEEVRCLQLRFFARHFMHLTGVRTSRPMRSVDFFHRCVDGRISEHDLRDDVRGLSEVKLEAARAMFQSDLSATSFGEVNGARLYVGAEGYAGNAWACLGFVRDGAWYDPMTLLRSPVSDEVSRSGRYRVVAVFSKEIRERNFGLPERLSFSDGDDWDEIGKRLPEELAYLTLVREEQGQGQG